ncbi:MAG TPA: ribosome biogenesis GTPase YqeH, partial [Trichococcus flocculiformis]|nr:ribosome biogenesis GTPase YqeH [Trichococcus flocculiformis]
FLGGASRFDFISGEKSSFTCYFANDLKIHRTKLEKADEFYAKHLGTLLQPPSAEDAENFSPLVRREFNVKVPSDIVF